MSEKVRTIKVSDEIAKELKKFVANNGGTIKLALESGAVWVMTNGAKEYLQKIKNK
jgi:hypothetical protein